MGLSERRAAAIRFESYVSPRRRVCLSMFSHRSLGSELIDELTRIVAIRAAESGPIEF